MLGHPCNNLRIGRIYHACSGCSPQILLQADVTSRGTAFPDVALCQRAVMPPFVPRPCIRLPRWVWLGVAVVALALPSHLSAQFREGFESPQPSWRLREADCGVNWRSPQERTFQESHSGNGCECLRLKVGSGTYVRVAHPIGKAALIPELAPSLWVKSDKPNIQIMLRFVLPRTIDETTGEPLTDFILGDAYTDVGRWQELKVTDPVTKLDKVVWAHR